MTEDSSLDEFLDAGEDDDGSDAQPTDSDASEGETAAAEVSESVDPAVSTYSVAPEGVACERCGESVRARWRDEGAFVCGDCKSW